MIALIDYGAGNLASVRKALATLGAEVFEPAAPDLVRCASGIIVPGVGHFGSTASLDQAWRGAIAEALGQGTPILGICLGMQWLFEGSDEAPAVPGLGALRGRITRLPGLGPNGASVKVPHVGWNRLDIGPVTASHRAPVSSRLFAGVPPGSYVYFTHAYAAPATEACAARTVHGRTFAAAVEQGPIWGVQFHPEKSGEVGLSVLGNFVTAASGPPARRPGSGS